MAIYFKHSTGEVEYQNNNIFIIPQTNELVSENTIFIIPQTNELVSENTIFIIPQTNELFSENTIFIFPQTNELVSENENLKIKVRHVDGLELERDELVRQLELAKEDLFTEQRKFRMEREELKEVPYILM